jgi:thymidylate synthase
MNNIDKQYQALLQDILDNGIEKKDRTGTGTISVFGRQIRHKMSEGFPLLTTKKMAWKTMVTELLWFLRGDTSIEYLLENDCNIWTGDAYKNYVIKVNMQPGVPIGDFLTQEEFINKIKTDDEFAKKWGELGPIYGKQWRSWKYYFPKKYSEINEFEQYVGVKTIDQIQNLINDLKTNPDSRRLMVNAWNVGELDQMVLPPCHYGFQVYTRELTLDERIRLVNYDKENFTSIDKWVDWYNNLPEEFYHDGINYTKETNLDVCQIPKRAISLMWNQRSVDTLLGLPFNIASYGLLLEIIAKEVNMVPDELIGNLGDTHLYANHIEQAKEQISREPFELPKLNINENNKMRVGGGIFTYVNTDFELVNYQSHPAIKAPLSN